MISEGMCCELTENIMHVLRDRFMLSELDERTVNEIFSEIANVLCDSLNS